MKDAESALAAYKAGELDAVTNANFEPLAVKLLASYQDFRRTTYNAVTFYEFNRERKLFSDKRVREALALAIDRDRLTQDEMDGAAVSAQTFLPNLQQDDLKFDVQKAKRLLSEAGFENGKNFPKIKLLINRNDLQRRIAKAVSAQWRRNLGIETEIVASSFEEFELQRSEGDFDIVRRSAVLPTTNETANLLLMFGSEKKPEHENAADLKTSGEVLPNPLLPPNSENASMPAQIDELIAPPPPGYSKTVPETKLVDPAGEPENALILNEADALEQIPAIPLYFPSSYALIKPYVNGFEPNLLDAPSLKNVRINADWQTK
jgi:oligopeptide transport system substrate-binding protein